MSSAKAVVVELDDGREIAPVNAVRKRMLKLIPEAHQVL